MKILKQAILCLVLAVSTLTLVSGCRTAEGFGEDMENAGQEIQKETR